MRYRGVLLNKRQWMDGGVQIFAVDEFGMDRYYVAGGGRGEQKECKCGKYR